MEMAGERPDVVIGCVGGGSNYAGLAYPFMQDRLQGKASTRFLAAEPAACPTLTRGDFAYDFGDTGQMTPLLPMFTLGHTFVPAPVHAGGLRYHGDAPSLSMLVKHGHMEAKAYTQNPVFEAAIQFAQAQGIVPGPEPAHAVRAVFGAAGHVLDFDDTYAPGLAHCTAPVAPAVLVVGAELGRSIDDVLSAYGRGFEATAALARGSHPELYRRGWHPTAVCGVVGAAVGSAAILGLDDERTTAAMTLSLLQAAGLRSAFGSGGKPLQVGMAAASGARAALLAREGASAPAEVRAGFEMAYGATWAVPDPERPAIHENWIKAYPCCLQTHSAIEAADMARLRYSQKSGAKEELRVFVHAVSLQAAPYGVPADSLQAKFSIPYTTAFSFLHGPPTVGDFRSLDPEALELSGHIEVLPDLDV